MRDKEKCILSQVRYEHALECLQSAKALVELGQFKSVEYYLSKGFDRPMAEYFASGRKAITSVAPNKDFTLTLGFDNGEQRVYDCKPLLKAGTVFEPFLQYENFARVYLDEQKCVAWDRNPNVDSEIVWSNKVNICPDSCYVDSKPLL